MLNISGVLIPLLGLAIFSVANGYLMSLVPIVLEHGGYSDLSISIMSGVFHLGIMVGAFTSANLMKRLGYIRSFSTCSVIFIILISLQTLEDSLWFWFLLRFLSGVVVAGIFVVIESWLMLESTPKDRGKLLAIYMFLYYCSVALGQKLLGFFGVVGTVPYLIMIILMALSVLPILMRTSIEPTQFSLEIGSIFSLFKWTPTGVMGGVVGGVLTGIVYGLMPSYFSRQGFDVATVGNYMTVIIIGGMIFQYPTGKLSDAVDRRWILVGIGILGSLISFVLALSILEELYMLWLFVLGGVVFTLYPLSISHSCDHASSEEVVSVIQGLLLIYSLGAIMGPLIISFMLEYTPYGMFYITGLITAMFGLFAFVRIYQRVSIVTGPDDSFVPLLMYTPLSSELTPRKEDEEGANEDTGSESI